jgi:hypothetical protein
MIEFPATRVAPWKAEPRRLWSLLDMIEFYGADFVSELLLFQEIRLSIQRRARGGEEMVELSGDDKRYVRHIVRGLEDRAPHVGLKQSAIQASEARFQIEFPMTTPTFGVVDALLSSLASHIGTELQGQRFAYIPLERHRYFEADNLFGLSMPNPMPSSGQDIRDAGNAYAVGLHTATVFHLMRVAEIGLRALAKHLRVTVRHKGKPIPIEWAQWEKILQQISARIDALSQPKKAQGPQKKQEDRAFYRGLLAELEGFKDMYRNDVMHVRKHYDHFEAASAIEKVGGFMRRLTSRLHE